MRYSPRGKPIRKRPDSVASVRFDQNASGPQRRHVLATDEEGEVKPDFRQRVQHGAHRANEVANTGISSARMRRLMLIDTALNVTVSGTFRQESSKEENLESPQLSNNTRHVKLRLVRLAPTTNGLKVYAQHKTSNRRKALTFNDLRRNHRQAKALRICKIAPYWARLSVFRRHRQGHRVGEMGPFSTPLRTASFCGLSRSM